MRELRTQIERQLAQAPKATEKKKQALRRELSEVTREISRMMDLVSRVANPRRLIEGLDELERRRSECEQTIEAEGKAGRGEPASKFATGASPRFLEDFRKRLDGEDTERKKAPLRSPLDRAVLDRDDLTPVPRWDNLTRVKMASPRVYRLNPRKKCNRPVNTVFRW